MRRQLAWILIAAVALGACGDDPEPASPAASSPSAPTAPGPSAGSAGSEVSAAEATKPQERLLALRRYEQVINGQRAGVHEVRWFETEYEGRRVVKDITEFRSRSARMMGRVRTVFQQKTIATTIRTESGDLIRQEMVTDQGSRTDRERIERTADGYRVTTWTGPNEETFTVETPEPVQVDAETFLGPRILAGEATPGSTWKLPLLHGPRRAVVHHTLRVIGPDDEGPGLKVVQSFEGNDMLWWFSDDGSVVRIRSGISVTRRADHVSLDDLPDRPAAWRVTLPSNVNLPRIFTGRTMVVDVEVETDETTRPPRIPPNPFTETVKEGDEVVRLLLKSHDDPGAKATLPIPPQGFEDELKPTPLMEVDDPVLRRRAQAILGDEKDARAAAAKIADFVFKFLQKGSPDIGQPTAKAILENPLGDCSEHALLFAALCRAAGIPARRCSGYVCIGSDWGAHAWCEIWVGKWIGADPTTNEIGTRARYIFLAHQDDPDSKPGSITAERTRIMIRRVEYVDGTLDFETKAEPDPVVYSGIRVGETPEGWQVRHYTHRALVRGPTFQAVVWIQADHGYRDLSRFGGTLTRFGSRPARRYKTRSTDHWFVPLGRQNLRLQIRIGSGDEDPAAKLAELLAPTLDRDDG